MQQGAVGRELDVPCSAFHGAALENKKRGPCLCPAVSRWSEKGGVSEEGVSECGQGRWSE